MTYMSHGLLVGAKMVCSFVFIQVPKITENDSKSLPLFFYLILVIETLHTMHTCSYNMSADKIFLQDCEFT